MRPGIVALVLGLLVGAGSTWLVLRRVPPKVEPHAAEEETFPISVWTDRTEVFIEHTEIEPGTPAEFLAHVSVLATGEPRTSGAIAYLITPSDPLKSGGLEISDAGPVRPGIYKTRLTFEAGHWRLAVRIDSETIDLGEFHAHAGGEKHDHADEPAEGISFLKEQQWKLRTRAEPLQRARLVQRLRVPGIVTAAPGTRAALSAPVEGRLLGPLPSVGDKVVAGQVLAQVQPPFSDFGAKLIESEAEIVRARVALDQAENSASRIRKLVAEKARPERDLLDAEFALRSAKANHEAAQSLRAAYEKSGARLAGDGLPVFEIRSPIAGTIVRVAGNVGEHVHPEDAIFTVLDSSRVRIEARIPEGDVGRLGGTRAAVYETPDAPGRRRPAGDAPVFISPEVDPATRTVALVYELANEEDLRLGMALTLLVETARAEDGLSLPETAIVDEEGRSVAFVQVAGETFQKRDLALGIRDAGRAQVLSGLAEGERVVTKGAYAVRLASVATSIPAHGHEH
jgi:cobalt-zinc-cadmium efflux system membrane fusion protein